VGRLDDVVIVATNLDDGSTLTILTGSVSDQAALHGLLGSSRDLRQLLLSVRRVKNQEKKLIISGGEKR
jgi:hypothetical protein